MHLEKRLGEQFEGKWARVVKHVIETRALPPDDQGAFGDLYQFAAFQAVRVPRIRRQNAEFMDQAEKARLRATFATDEGRAAFRSFIDQLRPTLSPGDRKKLELALRDDPGLDHMAEYANSGDFDITVDQTWHIGMMLQLAAAATICFGSREWALWPVADDAPDLMCSDSPVCLTWARPTKGPYSPGFGMPDTLVTMPLAKRLMLVSTLGEVPPARTLDKTGVAEMNARTAMYADQVYAADDDFIWLIDDKRLGNAGDFLKSEPHLA